MGEALERTVEAGQSLIVRRMELLVAETRVLIQDGGMLLVGGVVGLIGWIYLLSGATIGLADHYPRFAVELAVGALHIGAAVLLFTLFIRRRSR